MSVFIGKTRFLLLWIGQQVLIFAAYITLPGRDSCITEETPGESGYRKKKEAQSVMHVALHMESRHISHKHKNFICWISRRCYHCLSICLALTMNCSCIFKIKPSYHKHAALMWFFIVALDKLENTEFAFASCKICLVLQLAASDSRMMCTYFLEYIFLFCQLSWHQARTDLLSCLHCAIRFILQCGFLTRCWERFGHQ